MKIPPASPHVRLRQRFTIALATLPAVALVTPAFAADSTWNVTTAGLFSTASNWTSGVPGAASGTTSTDIATFQRSALLTASRIVTFDTATNLGGITFDNTSAVAGRVFTVSAATLGGATPALTLSPNAVIENTGSGTNVSGAHTLDVALVLSGNTTFSNTYGNSVINIGATNGLSANSITTGTGLGNIDLTLTGTSTGGNLISLRLNQATGTTLRVVKEGTGFWQLNGPTTTSSTMTGGLLIRQGGVSIGRNSNLSIGSGAIVIGDETTTASDLRLSLGSSVNVSSAITVAASSAPNVIFERGGGSGAGTFSGSTTLARDLLVRQATTANQALNFNASSSLGGTGNIIVNTTVASAGTVNFQGSVNMAGKLTNQSTTGTGLVTISGLVGSSVTEIVQNSATSAMTITNSGNLFGKTTIDAGTLNVTGTGRLGTGDVTVNAGTLNLANNAALSDAATLLFGNSATINLNFAGFDTIDRLGSISGTFVSPGTYGASALNTFFGGSVFTGSGSLEVLSAIPEPSAFAALAGLGMLGFAAARRRAGR